ncbi:MAG: hypothetical protein HQL51_12295 [Magnetococcales bacterium]|nr:hypothetical protein [Magnetococcales bacterium]
MIGFRPFLPALIRSMLPAALGLFLSGAALAGEIPNVPHPEFWGVDLPVLPNMSSISLGELYYDQNNDLNVRYFLRPDAEQSRHQNMRKQPYINFIDRSFNIYKGHINWESQVWRNPVDETEKERLIGEKNTDEESLELNPLQEIYLLQKRFPDNRKIDKGYYVVNILSNDWCALPSDHALKRVDQQGNKIFNVMVFKRLPKREVFYKEHGKCCDFSVRERIGRVRNMALYPTLYDMEDGTMLYAPNRTPYLIRFHGKFESPFLDRHPSLVSVDADLIEKLVTEEEDRLYQQSEDEGVKINVLEKIDDMLSNLFKPMFEKKGIKP